MKNENFDEKEEKMEKRGNKRGQELGVGRGARGVNAGSASRVVLPPPLLPPAAAANKGVHAVLQRLLAHRRLGGGAQQRVDLRGEKF